MPKSDSSSKNKGFLSSRRQYAMAQYCQITTDKTEREPQSRQKEQNSHKNGVQSLRPSKKHQAPLSNSA